MGKKKSWFTCVKRLFLLESKSKYEEKSKLRRWFLEKLHFRQYPALEATPQTTLNKATEEQRKRALAVVVATAAAAEAAVAAANAAAEVVRLTNIPYEIKLKTQRLMAIIKIQSAYRGHLARKALSALKGIVKLQAVIRGELVRKFVAEKLRSMCIISKSKPDPHQERVATLVDYLNHGAKRHSLSLKERIKSEKLKLECNANGDMDWDLRMGSGGDLEGFYHRKQAIAKRERMKQYSYSHRERRNDRSLLELIAHKENRKSSRFDEWIELKLHKHGEKECHKPFSHSKTIAVDMSQQTQQKLRTSLKQEMMEELHSPSSLPRRSFCDAKQKSIRDDESLTDSPVFPAYMAATESAKAKSRSFSTPKQRLRLCDTYSGHSSPHKLRLSSWNSFNSDTTNTTKRNSISQHLSTLQ